MGKNLLKRSEKMDNLIVPQKTLAQKSQSQEMITPAGSIEQALEQFQLYQELKQKLGTSNDFQQIGDKKHPKKSFVRKIQRFFNISCELLQDEPLRDEHGAIIAWLAKARAIHLTTGAFQDADGSCSFSEKVARNPKQQAQMRTIHNIRAHAVTRAKNRAILDLVGFGEVSAEEINQSPSYHQKPRAQSRIMASQKQIGYITSLLEKQHGFEESQWRQLLQIHTRKQSRSDLTRDDASKLIKILQERSTTELLQDIEKNK